MTRVSRVCFFRASQRCEREVGHPQGFFACHGFGRAPPLWWLVEKTTRENRFAIWGTGRRFSCPFLLMQHRRDRHGSGKNLGVPLNFVLPACWLSEPPERRVEGSRASSQQNPNPVPHSAPRTQTRHASPWCDRNAPLSGFKQIATSNLLFHGGLKGNSPL